MKMKTTWQERLFQICITTFLVLFALLTLIPLISTVALSFSSKAAADMNIVYLWPVDFTFASWKYTLAIPEVWRATLVSFVTTIIGVFLAVIVTSLMAYPLSKPANVFCLSRFLMKAVVFTMIFSAPMVPYFLTLKNMGLYNNPLVLILPHAFTAYNMVVMRTFFKQFPEEIEESAKIDGAGPFRIFFSIVLRESKAVVATVSLFSIVTIWNQYQHPQMFIVDTKWYTLQYKVRQLTAESDTFELLELVKEVNYSGRTLRATVTIFAMIPILVIYPFLQKYFEKGAMMGSVKG